MPEETKKRFEEKFGNGYKDPLNHSVQEIVREEHLKFLESECQRREEAVREENALNITPYLKLKFEGILHRKAWKKQDVEDVTDLLFTKPIHN